MPNIFNEKGLSVNNALDFRDMLTKEATIAFADKLDGAELRADDSSVLGRLLTIVSKSLAQNAEILPIILQSMDINSAEGKQLDNLLWNLHRTARKGASQASGLVVLHGDLGVVVPRGSAVSNSLTSDVFKTNTNVKFTNFGCSGVDIEIVRDKAESISIAYTIDGILSKSPSVDIKLQKTELSTKDIATRLVDAINSQSSYLYATRNNDNSVRVEITDKGYVGSFTVNGAARVVRSYMPVSVTSESFNSRESLVGQVNSIKTPILGWRGVSNPYTILKSQEVETDEEYRYRGKLYQNASYGKYTSILMAIKSVKGVTYENIQINTSRKETSSGITNNGLSITVMGGNEDEIAMAIFETISEGIATVGDIVKNVKDINGFGHEIRFSRPKVKPIQISMSLITYPDFPSNGVAIIKQAIVDWFNNLDVGEDIHYSRLYQPINSVRGFAVKNLKFGYKGGSLGLEDIVINHNEIATISAEDINIGGN